MKILMTYPYLTGKGGIETVTAKILNATPKDIELDFLLSGGSDDLTWMNKIDNLNGGG